MTKCLLYALFCDKPFCGSSWFAFKLFVKELTAMGSFIYQYQCPVGDLDFVLNIFLSVWWIFYISTNHLHILLYIINIPYICLWIHEFSTHGNIIILEVYVPSSLKVLAACPEVLWRRPSRSRVRRASRPIGTKFFQFNWFLTPPTKMSYTTPINIQNMRFYEMIIWKTVPLNWRKNIPYLTS